MAHGTRLGVSVRCLMVVAGLVSLAGVIDAAHAQDRGPGRGGMGMMMWGGGGSVQPTFLRRDLPLMVERLQLDASQRTIVAVFLQDYQDEFDVLSESMRERMDAWRPQRTEAQEQQRQEERQQRRALFDEMRQIRQALGQVDSDTGQPPLDEAVRARLERRLVSLQTELDAARQRTFQTDEIQKMLQGMADVRRDWRAERDKLDGRFIADVFTILRDDQLDRWPEFERTLRRLKTMSRGRYSGERVDLFLLLRELGIDPALSAELTELLESYALTLDQALIARNAHLDDARDAARLAAIAGETDTVTELATKEASLRVRVRAANEQSLEAIAGLLDAEGRGDELRTAFRARAFARVYRPTVVQRAFDAVLAMPDLDADVLEAVAALQTAYLAELAGRNEQIVRITRQEEPTRTVQRAQRGRRGMGGGRRGGERSEDPIRAAFRERAERDADYRKQLEALLNPEQIAMLPAAPARQQRRGGFSERMLELDLNADGKIQKSEIPEPMQQFFDRVDSNRDGAIDEEEMNSFFSSRRGHAAQRARDAEDDAGGSRRDRRDR